MSYRFVFLLAVVLSCLVVSRVPAGTYFEDFSTTTYRDPDSTTAAWDTVSGVLHLESFAPTAIGSLATPGCRAGI